MRKKNGVPVLQLLDKDGLVNFENKKMRVRKMTNISLLGLEHTQKKVRIYAVGSYQVDHEFELMFSQILQGKTVIAIMTLFEHKDNLMLECDIGDFLFKDHNGNLSSFRELLIRLKVTYPSRVREQINQRILMSRARYMSLNNVGSTFIKSEVSNLAGGFNVQAELIAEEPIEILDDRFHIYEVLGEGGVSHQISFLFLCFCG